MRVRFALALVAAMTAAGVVAPRAYGANLLPSAPTPANARSADSHAPIDSPTPAVSASTADSALPVGSAPTAAAAAVVDYDPDASVSSPLPDDIDFIDLNLGQADFPPLGYVFEGTFFHRDACEAAGTSGIPRAWPGYVCLGGDVPWDFSDLYVRDFG